MKAVWLALGAIILGVALWYLIEPRKMEPYPLLDPKALVSVLPDLGVPDKSQTSDPKYFNDFGYLKGDRGTGIAIVSWSKRPVPASDPYDVDLTIRIIATPSASIAQEGLILEKQQDQTLMAQLKGVEVPLSLSADQFEAVRLKTMYMVSARYGNYMFKFVAKLAAGGYFEDEKQLFERLRTLDAHIHTTLKNAAQQGVPADRPRPAGESGR